jgi:uncharacterized protein (UPF0216 family)
MRSCVCVCVCACLSQLNVREASHAQIKDNAEVTAIKKILGLETGKQYTDAKQLRYGHVMIMADQYVVRVRVRARATYVRRVLTFAVMAM